MASEISKITGKRIRSYRIQKGLSQEKLAELAGCHPTYIGQLERGEKNATLESIEKIASALDVPLAKLFDKYENERDCDIPSKCYDFLLSKNEEEQKILYQLILDIDNYKKIS